MNRSHGVLASLILLFPWSLYPIVQKGTTDVSKFGEKLMATISNFAIYAYRMSIYQTLRISSRFPYLV